MARTPSVSPARKITTLFLAAAGAWIALSDVVMLHGLRPPFGIELEHIATDLFFTVATAALLFKTVSGYCHKSAAGMRALQEQLRAFHLITECDSVVWRTQSREELFQEVCRLAVEEGGYRMAWVGLPRDDAAKTVLPVARAGTESGYVDGLKLVWSDTPRGRGPTGTCLRTGTPDVCRFLEKDARLAPWREAALGNGFLSTIALPLRQGTRVAASLTLYSEREDAFDSAEKTLLNLLAKSISYALEHLDRIEREAALFAKMKMLVHALDNSPMSVVITDARGAIEFVNRKFTDISGYSADEAIGRNPRMLKTGETCAQEYRALWETISSGRNWNGIFHNRRKNGDTYWEAAIISPVRDADGEIRHYICIKEDLSDKRSLEQQLRQAQKMDSLGALAGGVAHDFNNLLTVIGGHCELLTLAGLPTPGSRESVSEIRDAAGRAAVMTKRLLQFGRKQAMNVRTVDLGAVAWESVRMLRRLLGEAYPLEIARPSSPLTLRADAGMLEQVMMNLAINARDSMPRGGTITLSVARADENTAVPNGAGPAPDGFLRLTVEDRGSGIAAGDLQRIFEPFYTTKDPSKGTGLGLSVVDGIVRQHKGWIWVDSVVGKGSVFNVYLPASPEPAEAPSAPPPDVPLKGTEKILLVEDETPLRALTARVLGGLGYDVTQADSGPAALAAWNAQPGRFQMLLTDMVMPGGMTGVELARCLVREQPGLRVLLTSGYHRELEQTAGEPQKGLAFLPKPYMPLDLSRAVRAELDRV
ncbi:MAG: PAS domain S-box protein [Elusimicrobiota bacterium]